MLTCESRAWDSFNRLEAHGPYGDAGDAPPWTRAMFGRRWQDARLLSMFGCDPNEPDAWRMRPLDWAVIHWATSWSFNSITGAATRSEVQPWVERLLAKGADPTRPGALGRTALHWAALSEHPSAQLVFERGVAAIEIRDEDGDTPLALALRRGNAPAARALIALGADVNASAVKISPTGRHWTMTPLALAFDAMRDQLESESIAKGMAVSEDECVATELSARAERLAVVSDLLQAGASPNAPCWITKPGAAPSAPKLYPVWRCLFYAFSGMPNNGDAVILARQLIDRGLNLNAVDDEGCRPLHWAAKDALDEVGYALLDAGADPRTRDSSGDSARDTAAMVGRVSLALRMDAVAERLDISEAVASARPAGKLKARRL